MQMAGQAHWGPVIALHLGTAADFLSDGVLQRHTGRSRARISAQDIGLAEVPPDVGCYHPF